jgi:electron transport complex protein RnfD
MTARVVLMVSFPTAMSRWVLPFWYRSDLGVDALTTATPLASGETPELLRLFFGVRGGCMGETCIFAILLGAAYLLLRRVIQPWIPLCYVGTVFVFSWILGTDPVVAILSGGLMFGAVFMATDYTTSPITLWGKVVFGVGAGILTVLIRQFASLPEGVSYSILLMNILVPHIEKLTRPIPFGESRKKKN